VLHVTEALGGGITTALREYAASTPDFEHILLGAERGAYAVDGQLTENFAMVIPVGRGWWRLAAALPDVLRRTRPDIVHLHSAWAGFVGRAVIRRGSVPLIYSPHSFYFEREDIPPSLVRLARATERAMAGRTKVIMCLTPHECAQAEALGARAVEVPNAVDPDLGALVRPQRPGGKPMVVTIGRAAPQKDPTFFIEVVQQVAALGAELEWTWIGDGSADAVRALRAAGVLVTGWETRARGLERLSQATLYLHTAAWEGSPMTLLEASCLGVPAVARSIPALVSLGFPDALNTPAAVARAITAALDRQPARARALETWQVNYLQRHSRHRQAAALTGLYESVLAG
jgi:glycosyltransferase involved in cell wall biosynthesis